MADETTTSPLSDEVHERLSRTRKLLNDGDSAAALENAYALDQLLSRHPEARRADKALEEIYDEVKEILKGLEDAQEPASGPTRHISLRSVGFYLGLLLLIVLGYFFIGPIVRERQQIDRLQSFIRVMHRDELQTRGIEVTIDLKDKGRTIVYDLTEVAPDTNPETVFYMLQTFAKRAQDEPFDRVTLAFGGTPKFVLDAAYFRTLGKAKNTATSPQWTFPENVRRPDGSAPWPHRDGNWREVAQQQREDFEVLMKEWYEP